MTSKTDLNSNNLNQIYNRLGSESLEKEISIHKTFGLGSSRKVKINKDTKCQYSQIIDKLKNEMTNLPNQGKNADFQKLRNVVKNLKQLDENKNGRSFLYNLGCKLGLGNNRNNELNTLEIELKKLEDNENKRIETLKTEIIEFVKKFVPEEEFASSLINEVRELETQGQYTQKTIDQLYNLRSSIAILHFRSQSTEDNNELVTNSRKLIDKIRKELDTSPISSTSETFEILSNQIHILNNILKREPQNISNIDLKKSYMYEIRNRLNICELTINKLNPNQLSDAWNEKLKKHTENFNNIKLKLEENHLI